METFSQEIPKGAVLFRVDVTLLQGSKPKEVGQPEGIVIVIQILPSRVLLDGGRIGQMHSVSMIHQGIHEPIPVVGRFYYNPSKFCAVRFQRGQNNFTIVEESLF